MGDSSDIDALIKDMNSDSLSNEENSMVNSILNDLNGPSQGGQGQGGQGQGGQGQGGPPPKITSQQNMPQITEEEKEMLIKQQMQQQQIAQQRMQQQMAQQQMMQEQQRMQQQQQQQQQQKQVKEDKPENTMDMVKNIFFEYKDVVIVLFLSILFNLEIISENLKIKNVSFLYDMEKGKETILSTIMKGFIIAVIYLVLKLIIK